MGTPTKALLLQLWMSGQHRQQQFGTLPPSSPEVISALPPGCSPEVIEALPPGVPLNKSTKVEQARIVRAYNRLNLTKDELTGDEESKQKVQAAWAQKIKEAVVAGQDTEKKYINQARDILMDEAKRQDYNAVLEEFDIEDGRAIPK